MTYPDYRRAVCVRCGANVPRYAVTNGRVCRDCLDVPDPGWQERAACADAPDPTIFDHGAPPSDVWQALAYCDGCPVRDPCDRYAAWLRIDHGVWGGRARGNLGQGVRLSRFTVDALRDRDTG
jgi:hypothetical protein